MRRVSRTSFRTISAAFVSLYVTVSIIIFRVVCFYLIKIKETPFVQRLGSYKFEYGAMSDFCLISTMAAKMGLIKMGDGKSAWPVQRTVKDYAKLESDLKLCKFEELYVE